MSVSAGLTEGNVTKKCRERTDPDPLVRGTDPDLTLDSDPSIIK